MCNINRHFKTAQAFIIHQINLLHSYSTLHILLPCHGSYLLLKACCHLILSYKHIRTLTWSTLCLQMTQPLTLLDHYQMPAYISYLHTLWVIWNIFSLIRSMFIEITWNITALQTLEPLFCIPYTNSLMIINGVNGQNGQNFPPVVRLRVICSQNIVTQYSFNSFLRQSLVAMRCYFESGANNRRL